ncbi:hypothetical protein GSI_07825 [Ganoderma sinense ZZ0214-1]|uniref:Uncharacterized protein n=1 Tax=Ganoderma sinense ZZ0214-1 TaxID=1077348 RepID=A0A2G8S843_9APHY|nr:hypothetical protein GSI_07825 [Ganoderma sinense ZZ0214-1]
MYQRWDNASPDLGTLLMNATRSAASHLYLSMIPFVDRRFSTKLLVSISAVGPQGTFHLATLPFHTPNTFTAAPGWDNAYATFLGSILGDSSSFSAVREVWISGVYPEAHYHTRIAAAFREAIAGLQALETFVLVEPPRSFPHAVPTISLCPDAQGSAPVPPNLRTLRLVCEDGAHWGRSGGGNRLRLGVLLAELETGAYAYFDTLVLELRSWLDVTPEDLVQLKAHFATVTCLHVDQSQTGRPLPDYCVESCGGPGGTGTLLGARLMEVANTLTELAATLREELNSRSALFKLPVELLQKILEQVPHPFFRAPGPFVRDTDEFRPSWRSSAKNTYMLMPVLQTCRQLRRISLSHKSLWKTIDPTGRYSLPSILLQKGCDAPLIVVIDASRASDGSGEALGNLDEGDVQRMQELHVFELYIHRLPEDNAEKIYRYFNASMPLLESLSISQVFTSEPPDWHIDEGECPFPLDHAPRLRHMMLHDVTFTPRNGLPHLTHLSLAGISTPNIHIDTVNLLSRCSSLETLAIYSPYLSDTLPNLSEGLSRPLNLNRLRRLTLQLPCRLAMEFYLSLFPLDSPTLQPTAVQILEFAASDMVPVLGQTLRRVTKAEASHLSLALHPHPQYRNQRYLSFTAAGPEGTFHISTDTYHVDVVPLGDLDVLPQLFLDTFNILSGCAHLRAVREVWVTSVPPQTGRRFFRDVMGHFKSIIAALPALETVVVVVPAAGAQLETDLGVLPSTHDPGFVAPSSSLKNLRIVHGTDAPTGRESVEKIRLTGLLDQIGSAGAYGYFENVVLQMTRQLEVDEEDLARLEACFKNVSFQHVDSMPAMPLPEYCTEPYAGPGGTSTWHGSLW